MGNKNTYDPKSPVHFNLVDYATPFTFNGLVVYATQEALDLGLAQRPSEDEKIGLSKYLDAYAQNQYKSFESKAALANLVKPHSTLYDQTNKALIGGLNKGEKFVSNVFDLGDDLLSLPGDIAEFINNFKYPLIALGLIVAVKVVKD